MSLFSSNILLLPDLTAVLTDFGLSCRGEFPEEPDASFMESGSTTVGTRCYMPPEAFKGIFSTRSDSYSFGMVSLHLFGCTFCVQFSFRIRCCLRF